MCNKLEKIDFSTYISNILFFRFPQKSLVDAFYILGMRSISFESDETVSAFGNEELEQILSHFGEEMVSRWTSFTNLLYLFICSCKGL